MSKKSMEDRFMDAADSASQAGKALAGQRLSGKYSLTGRDGRRSLQDIKSRPSGSTRTLDPYHVVDLAESIATLGLLQPIAIDKNNFLIAGEHRLEACRLLDIGEKNSRLSHWKKILSNTDKKIKKADEELIFSRISNLNHNAFKKRYHDRQISVLVLPLNAKRDVNTALAAEAAENEKRQNYSKDEITRLAEKLKKAGFIEPKGRPKKGENSLKRALTVISGKSYRQIERDLSSKKKPTHDGLFDHHKESIKLLRLLHRFNHNLPESGLHKQISSLIETLDKYIDDNINKNP